MDPDADTTSRLRSLLSLTLADNPFYRNKYQLSGLSLDGPLDPDRVPFTTKSELLKDQQMNPPFGSNRTLPLADYSRLHRTSGTTGRPLYWLDTEQSWGWWLRCWLAIYRAAGVNSTDRIFVPFSFGPFIGFWAAWDAGRELGAMLLPGGGLSSTQRLDMLFDCEATVLVCTPTYALRLAEAAREAHRDLAAGPIRLTIHAGEPGAGIPAVRRRIESAWGARVVDHAGATEVGAWGFSCGHEERMHILEDEFIAEVVDPGSDSLAVKDSEGILKGELVLTNLGRSESPVIRYRTGDQVTLSRTACPCGLRGAWLRGGVTGRVDDMLVVRGVNVYPSAIENVIQEFQEVDEFEVLRETERQMVTLRVRVESHDADVASRLRTRLRDRLGLDTAVEAVPPGSLPRHELKSRRFH